MILYEGLGQITFVIFLIISILFGAVAYSRLTEDIEESLFEKVTGGLFVFIILIISLPITYLSYKEPGIVGGLIMHLIGGLIKYFLSFIF